MDIKFGPIKISLLNLQESNESLHNIHCTCLQLYNIIKNNTESTCILISPCATEVLLKVNRPYLKKVHISNLLLQTCEF